MGSIALLFDAGCFVLIWLVQLVVYPSFRYYSENNLKTWHVKYTKAITAVVLPLMLGQLILSALGTSTLNGLGIFKFGLVLLTWLTTFLIFVPLHKKIDSTDKAKEISQQLVDKNWIRTGLWSLIFIIALVRTFKP